MTAQAPKASLTLFVVSAIETRPMPKLPANTAAPRISHKGARALFSTAAVDTVITTTTASESGDSINALGPTA